jgi:hypothetical protein
LIKINIVGNRCQFVVFIDYSKTEFGINSFQSQFFGMTESIVLLLTLFSMGRLVALNLANSFIWKELLSRSLLILVVKGSGEFLLTFNCPHLYKVWLYKVCRLLRKPGYFAFQQCWFEKEC